MSAFITGSHAYGTPGEQSDVDLCIAVSEHDLELLAKHADEEPGSGGHSLRFGDLNIIVLSPSHLEAWREATGELIMQKPVTREKAVELIQAKVKALRKPEPANA